MRHLRGVLHIARYLRAHLVATPRLAWEQCRQHGTRVGPLQMVARAPLASRRARARARLPLRRSQVLDVGVGPDLFGWQEVGTRAFVGQDQGHAFEGDDGGTLVRGTRRS